MLAQAQQLTRSVEERANAAVQALHAAQAQWGQRSANAPGAFRRLAASGEAPKRAGGHGWWQPAAKPAPVLAQTDQQHREERPQVRAQHKEQARQEALARKSSAAVPTATSRGSQPTAPEVPSGAKPAEPGTRRTLTYWVQIAICFFMGSILHNRLVTIFAMVAVIAMYYLRKQRWSLFAGALVLATLLGYLVRPLM